MPTIPEILYIQAQERFIEIIRKADTKNIGRSNCHQAISGKIEEQVEAIAIHIPEQIDRIAEPAGESLHSRIKHGRQNQLVYQSQQNFLQAVSQKLKIFAPGIDGMKIFGKSTATVNRSGTEGGEKQQKTCHIQKRNFRNQPIIRFNNHLNDSERQIGYPKKSKNTDAKFTGDLA